MFKTLFKNFLTILFIALAVTNFAFGSISSEDVSKLPVKDLEKYLQRTETLLKEINIEGSDKELLEELRELLDQAILGKEFKELIDTSNTKAKSSKRKKVLYALGAVLGVAIICFVGYKVYRRQNPIDPNAIVCKYRVEDVWTGGTHEVWRRRFADGRIEEFFVEIKKK